MKLAELQRFFAEAATSGSGPRAELEDVFVTDTRLSAQARLGIYNRAYYYRLLGALGSVFEQVQRCMGQAAFERIGLSYLARHPSEHPAIERVGRSFPAYLRALGHNSVLVDLAELEWARLCVLVAPNPTRVVTRAGIDLAAFPHASLHLIPALRWLVLAPSALAAFAGEAVPEAGVGAPGESVAVAVWRQRHAVKHEQLGALEFQALQLAARGASTIEICSIFDTGEEAQDALRACHMFAAWLERGWLERLAVPER